MSLSSENAPYDVVAGLVSKARAAQIEYAKYTQEQVDEVVTAVAWTIFEGDNNSRLSKQAVAERPLILHIQKPLRMDDDMCVEIK